MHAAKIYQVRKEARMEIRIGDAEGNAGKGIVAWGCKWPEYKARSQVSVTAVKTSNPAVSIVFAVIPHTQNNKRNTSVAFSAQANYAY
jgi:hypothetical protein